MVRVAEFSRRSNAADSPSNSHVDLPTNSSTVRVVPSARMWPNQAEDLAIGRSADIWHHTGDHDLVLWVVMRHREVSRPDRSQRK